MPFSGGWSPSPERTGAGENGKSPPLVQRLFESLAAQKGSAYDQTINTAVGAETSAYARALTFDGYGSNQRLANEFIAPTAAGLLPRWEKIFNKIAIPGDTEPVRRGRILVAWSRIGQPNNTQTVSDNLLTLLGSALYVGLVHQNATNALQMVQGLSGVTATGTSPPLVTVTGTPSIWAFLRVEVTTGGTRDGGMLFRWSLNNGGSFVASGVSGTATFPLVVNGIATNITVNFPNSVYTNDNVYTCLIAPSTIVPWSSSLRTINVQLNIPVAYANPDGSPKAAWYALAQTIGPYLDDTLPSDEIWQWFYTSTSSNIGHTGFYLDDPGNLDGEIFDV